MVDRSDLVEALVELFDSMDLDGNKVKALVLIWIGPSTDTMEVSRFRRVSWDHRQLGSYRGRWHQQHSSPGWPDSTIQRWSQVINFLFDLKRAVLIIESFQHHNESSSNAEKDEVCGSARSHHCPRTNALQGQGKSDCGLNGIVLRQPQIVDPDTLETERCLHLNRRDVTAFEYIHSDSSGWHCKLIAFAVPKKILLWEGR